MLVLHDIIISYLMFFYFIFSADLISILFYSTLFQIDLIWFYSILFYWIWFTILFSIVSHINDWFVSICPSVRLSVCLSVCLSVWISLCFLFSPVSLLFSYERLPHTHTDTDTHIHIHMNTCSFLWLVHITSKGCKWRIVFEW